ncbi:hypothetical protein UA08_05075 [Talaromyces atroroseus]|uniref:Uncharacterized protein n=1 Tax=Talaromyces atroroseus TaxID=1441469 RepID=A0A225AXB7_TALAT|nr:hypothetical protein UA08_05075 [Talaromyces atroroseus]OKL59626.1 hypothetical protein UA08_05075 [Talaromyces atroroseus]
MPDTLSSPGTSTYSSDTIYHVWLQVLTLLLTTVVFVLGWFAIHRWIGWATLLLGIAQIPLGLTLYGSPKSLFILFSIGAFFWLALFFICSYVYDEDGANYGPDQDGRGSYVSGPPPSEERRHSGLGRMAAAAAGGAGLAALFRHRSHRRDESDVQSSYMDEKYSDEGQHRSNWTRRLIEIGAIGGGIALARSLFNRRRDRESDTESGRYRPTHARSDSMSEMTASRVEEGRDVSGTHSGTQGPYMHPARRQSYSSMDYSYYTQTDEGQENRQGHGQGHGVRDAILGAGAFAAVRSLFRRGKRDNEQQRVDEIKRRDMEEEKLARANSKRKYTGDGFYPRRQRPSQSVLSSQMTSDITPRPPRTPGPDEETVMTGGVMERQSDIPPAPPTHRVVSGSATGTDIESAAAAGAVAGAAAGSTSRHRRRSRSGGSSRRRSDRRDDVSSPPVSVKVRMHNDGRHVTLRRLTEEEAAASRESKRRSRERRGSRRRGSASSLSGNETSSSRWRRVEEMERRQAEQVQREQAAALAAESGAAAATAPPPPAQSPYPPLAPQPPAASFNSAHLPPPSASYAGNSQLSVPPPAPGPPPPPMIPVPSHAATSQQSMMPPRPPSNMQQYPPTASITSPGTWTGTEASADYANNRRRRRAERAQARARQQAQHSVEFT